MQADESPFREESFPPRSPLAVRRRAGWHLLCGLGGGMLPLMLAIVFFSTGWIDYNFLGGQCATCNNGHGLPLFYLVTGLFGVVCVAIPVCLIVKKLRFIGCGLFLAVLLTLLLVVWYVGAVTASPD